MVITADRSIDPLQPVVPAVSRTPQVSEVALVPSAPQTPESKTPVVFVRKVTEQPLEPARAEG